jgi:multidrug efflux pump subunit AcrB
MQHTLFLALLMLCTACAAPSHHDDSIVAVDAFFPHASAEQVEKELTIPLENALAHLKAIKRLKSMSSQGHSLIEVHFEGENCQQCLADVEAAIRTTRPNLPKNVTNPVVVLVTKPKLSALPNPGIEPNPSDKT